jgi:hypothetical protein
MAIAWGWREGMGEPVIEACGLVVLDSVDQAGLTSEVHLSLPPECWG